MSGARALRFGVFELDVKSGELRKAGRLVKLQQQPFKVLALLAGRPGELVTREEIQREVWGEGTFVDFEQGLNFCIKQIRAALGDQAESPRFVETLPRRGYRFIAPVQNLNGGAPSPPPAETLVPEPSVRKGTHRRMLWAAVAVVVLAALPLAAWLAARIVGGGSAARVVVAVLPFEDLTGDADGSSFADGLTEELIAQLGRVQPRRLGVIARGSAAQYRNRSSDVAAVGQDLGADYVVEGTVRRGDGRVRVTAKLIKVSDRTQLWAEAYDRPLAEVLTLQAELARAVTRAIALRLDPLLSEALERIRQAERRDERPRRTLPPDPSS